MHQMEMDVNHQMETDVFAECILISNTWAKVQKTAGKSQNR